MGYVRVCIMQSEARRTGWDEMIRELRSSTSPVTQMHTRVGTATQTTQILVTPLRSALARTEDAFEETVFVFGGPLGRIGAACDDSIPQLR